MLRTSILVLFGFVILIAIPVPALSVLHNSKIMEIHIHPTLIVKMNGTEITLPGGIGIVSTLWHKSPLDRYSDAPNIYAPLHTHNDGDGKIHVESTVFRRFTFGDFLNVWGIDRSKITGITVDGTEVNRTEDYPLRDGQNWTMEIDIETTPKNFTSYKEPRSGLTLQYPTDWNRSDPENNITTQGGSADSTIGERFLSKIRLSPPESSYLNTPNLDIDVYKLPSSNITLDQYTMKFLPRGLRADETRFPTNITLSNNTYNLDRYPAQRLELEKNNIYSSESSPQAYAEKFQKFMYTWSIIGDKLLFVTYRAYPNAYDQYNNTINRILDSIKID